MKYLPSSAQRLSALSFGLTALLVCACGGGRSASGSSTAGAGGSSTSSSGGTTASGGTSTASSGGAGEGGGILSGVGGGGGSAETPVRKIPNLKSITFWERTGGDAPTSYEFTVDGPQLTVRAADPLAPETSDIVGAGTEYYDVYYSKEDGTFDIDGSYLTISGSFLYALPAGGGLNLSEIGLNYSGATTEFGNYVASYVALGDNKAEMTVPNCIDGNLQTHTTMGNTLGSSERLRLTLGFHSSSGEPK